MGGDGGGAAGSGDGTRALDQTPTWAVAAVCAVIVAASILLEGLLHHLGQVRRPRTIPFPPIDPSLDPMTIFIFQLRLFSFVESFGLTLYLSAVALPQFADLFSRVLLLCPSC